MDPTFAATRLRWVSDPIRITTPTGLRLVLSQQRAQLVLKSDCATIAAYGVNSAATPLGLDLFRTWTQRLPPRGYVGSAIQFGSQPQRGCGSCFRSNARNSS